MRAVAVFIAGSENLVIGARYLLTLEGDQLTVTGPLDTSPARVCFTRRARDLEVSAVGGQLLLTSRSGPRLAVAFNTMPGHDPAHFERAFDANVATDAAS